jgi:hypothetical protein
MTGPLTSLVKKIDKATAKYSKCRMGSFVVFLNDDEGLAKQLKDFIKREGIKKTVLMIDNPSGPADYDINKKADVTVLLYVDKTVKVNHAYGKGKLTASDVDKIVAEVKKILPEDKK